MEHKISATFISNFIQASNLLFALLVASTWLQGFLMITAHHLSFQSNFEDKSRLLTVALGAQFPFALSQKTNLIAVYPRVCGEQGEAQNIDHRREGVNGGAKLCHVAA